MRTEDGGEAADTPMYGLKTANKRRGTDSECAGGRGPRAAKRAQAAPGVLTSGDANSTCAASVAAQRRLGRVGLLRPLPLSSTHKRGREGASLQRAPICAHRSIEFTL